MERSISVLLRAGVLLAALVVLLGGIFFLAHQGGTHPDYQAFRGEPAELRNPVLIFRSALSGNPRGVIQFGLLLLILTPIARVAFSVVAFARERDRMYVVMTLIVLAVLLYSLIAA
ncbi:MAG: DUF1634 domain-containing protein [Candidatus Acidiferrum sp.]